MKFDKITLKAQEALATAQQLAMAKSHTVLSPLHLLDSLLSDDEGMAVLILKKIGANVGRIKDIAQNELNRLAKGTSSGQMMPDRRLIRSCLMHRTAPTKWAMNS